MSQTRPDVSALPFVDDEEWLLRRIPKDAYIPSPADGKHLTTACFSKDDFKPCGESYGASAYVESKLPNGLADLIAADAKWQTCGVIRVQVKDLKQFNVEIRYSPHDCDYPDADLRAAHASFIGIATKDNRRKLIQFLESKVQPPAPP